MSKVEIVTRRAFICASLLVIAGTFNNPALGCNPGYSSNQDSQSQGSQYGYTGFQSYSNCPPSWQTSQVPQGGCPGYSGWQGCSGGSYLNVSTHEAPNLQTRVGYTYTVQTAIYTGWLDFLTNPNGQYEIVRYFEQRHPNNQFGAPIKVDSSTLNLPRQTISSWIFGFGLVQSTLSFMPTSAYGRETISLYWDPNPNTNAPWYQNVIGDLLVDLFDPTEKPVLLDSKQVLIYPTSSATITAPLQPAVNFKSVNTSSFNGDPPRLSASISQAYPGGTTWVAVYSGGSVTNPSSNGSLTNTTAVAPTTDYVLQRLANVDMGNQTSTAGTYTLQVLQSTPIYGVEDLGHATFSVNPTFNVNSEIGVTK